MARTTRSSQYRLPPFGLHNTLILEWLCRSSDFFIDYAVVVSLLQLRLSPLVIEPCKARHLLNFIPY